MNMAERSEDGVGFICKAVVRPPLLPHSLLSNLLHVQCWFGLLVVASWANATLIADKYSTPKSSGT